MRRRPLGTATVYGPTKEGKFHIGLVGGDAELAARQILEGQMDHRLHIPTKSLADSLARSINTRIRENREGIE